jgi:adenylosuccinate synthase
MGAEFGTTTGRPRRCGWLDGVALRHAARVNGLEALVVTKLDVLTGQDSVKVATAYRAGDRLLTEFPGRVDLLEQAEPVYEELPGWTESVEGARAPRDLPAAARGLLDRIGEVAGVPVSMVSVGPAREQTVVLG